MTCELKMTSLAILIYIEFVIKCVSLRGSSSHCPVASSGYDVIEPVRKGKEFNRSNFFSLIFLVLVPRLCCSA
jgi:hypothetical protein